MYPSEATSTDKVPDARKKLSDSNALVALPVLILRAPKESSRLPPTLDTELSSGVPVGAPPGPPGIDALA